MLLVGVHEGAKFPGFVSSASRPNDAGIPVAVADKEKGHEKDQTADVARFAFEEKSNQVKRHEHCVLIEHGWVHPWFGNEQYRN